MSGDEAAGSSRDGDAPSEVRKRVAASLATRPLLVGWGVVIAEVRPGAVSLHLPDVHAMPDPEQGGCDRSVVMAVADAAGWLSVVAGVKDPASVGSLEMKCDLAVPEQKVRALFAAASVIRQGRSLASVRSTVTAEAEDGSRQKICFIEATYILH